MSTANLQRFAELVSRDQFNLAEASLLLAQDAYPNLRVDEFLGRIDEIAATVRGRFAAREAGAAANLSALLPMAFRGCRQ